MKTQLKLIPFFLINAFIAGNLSAVECEWWQTKVRDHYVQPHQRGNSDVSGHPRSEHCREKWKHADELIMLFENSTPEAWPNKEIFAKWSRSEIIALLKLFPEIPQWLHEQRKKFYRAKKSVIKNNPASSDTRYGLITFYDDFFKNKSQNAILIHELAHLRFKNLSPNDINQIFDLVGWQIQIKDNQVFEIAPTKTIKEDSKLSKEEDFANLIEVYITAPKELEKFNSKIFEYFKKRFPL